MKTQLTFFIVLILFFTSSSGICQNAYWGLKGGLNINKVGGIDLDNSMYAGFNLGIFGTFVINDRISFSHEISYSNRGFNSELLNGEAYTFRLKYIDIPWMLNYHFNPAIFAQIGVQPSVYAFFKPAQYDSIPYTKYNANPFDFSGFIGAGVILKNNLIFGARINQSISKTFNISEAGGKQLTMQFYIGYAINRKVRRRYNFGSSGSR